MTKFNEQFDKIAAFQTEAAAPMKVFGEAAAEMFEKITRQNYAVLGDYIEFAVDQAKLPTQMKDASDYLSSQIEATRTFSEKMATRVQEYATIAGSAQEQVKEVSKAAAKKAA